MLCVFLSLPKFELNKAKIELTKVFFQLLFNSKLGSDQSTHSILSYIIGKSIVMRIKISL